MEIDRIASEPTIDVGIVHAAEIPFEMDGKACRAFLRQGLVFLECEGEERLCPEELVPVCGHFSLEEVCIGIDFHWQRTQRQTFEGSLRLIVDEEGLLTAVNRIPLERYLYSVIASEMKATSSPELLKAHAVISRSWLLAQLGLKASAQTCFDSPDEHIRWYERDAHRLFDVCADDHCQRYQGISHSGTPQVLEALQATRGLVLAEGPEPDARILDARFYKCCGGISERFGSCWADEDKPSLVPVSDSRDAYFHPGASTLPDLSGEEAVRDFICRPGDAFCNTRDGSVLSQVLNDYDLETQDFFRWEVSYTRRELSDIVRRKSGLDLGEILHLEPVERSRSGRLVRLRLVGSKRSLTVGKELEIRKWLSTSHLYSSAFVADETAEGFLLRGAGWGHGVGLCQIGAAVMASEGCSFTDILNHYYPGSCLKTLYV